MPPPGPPFSASLTFKMQGSPKSECCNHEVKFQYAEHFGKGFAKAPFNDERLSLSCVIIVLSLQVLAPDSLHALITQGSLICLAKIVSLKINLDMVQVTCQQLVT